MKTKSLALLILFVLLSSFLYSCTADSVTDNSSQVAPSSPKIQTNISAEEINTKPR